MYSGGIMDILPGLIGTIILCMIFPGGGLAFTAGFIVYLMIQE